MKKCLSLLICTALVLGTMAMPASAALVNTDVLLWDAETSENVTLGTNTSIKDAAIFDDASWNDYNIIGTVLPKVITGKVVNLSFDYKPSGTYKGAPSFRVDVFSQNQSWEQGSDGWCMGFYAYDPVGDNSHDKSEYYADAKFTYYGNENKANAEPYDRTTEQWVNGNCQVKYNAWQHIDCLYDLNNQTVTYYVDGTLLGSAKGPSSIGAIGFRKKTKDIYYGALTLDNVRLTEVNEKSLVWETEAEAGKDSFLLNFSEPVTRLAKGMVTLTDMETLTETKVSSLEKINPYQWRVNIENAKKNAEYKVEITALSSILGGTSSSSVKYAYTEAECRKGVVREIVNTGLEGSSQLPDGWKAVISDATFGTANPETKNYIETTGNGDSANNRIRIQNIGDWNIDKKYGLSAVTIPFTFSAGVTKAEIEFDAAYQKDSTLLAADTIRAADSYDKGLTGAMGTVGLDVGSDTSHWAKQALNFGSTTLYLEDKWGSKYNGAPVSGITLANNLSEMKSYKIIYDMASAKATIYCEETEIGSITYDAETKLYGIRFGVLMTAKTGAAAEEGAVLNADSNVMVVDNIKITETYDEQNFGVKKVRYSAVKSNVTMTEESKVSDNFSDYTVANHPGENTTNENDFADASTGLWSRGGHTKESSWWGQGTYVNTLGQLSVDAYSNTNPISVSAIRKISADAKGKILKTEFDMAYYVLQRHDGSSFTLYADEYPIFGADRNQVYLYDEQLVDEKLLLGTNGFVKDNYGTDLKKVMLSFDFINKKIRIDFDGMIKTTPMYDELAEKGIAELKFSVNLLNGIEGGNGDHRGNALVVDNYEESVLSVSNTPLIDAGKDACSKLAPTTSKIHIEFTNKVKEESLSGITVHDADETSVAYTPSLSADGKTAILAVALNPETQYTVIVPTTVTGVDGVNCRREHAFSFTTDRAIKFFDENGEEILDTNFEKVSYARVEVLASTPVTGEGKVRYLYAIYNKADDVLKELRIEEVAYPESKVIALQDAVKICDDEYAKVFLWNGTNVSPMEACFTFGK